MNDLHACYEQKPLNLVFLVMRDEIVSEHKRKFFIVGLEHIEQPFSLKASKRLITFVHGCDSVERKLLYP